MRRDILALLVCAGTFAPSELAAQFQTLETRDLRLVYTSPLQSYLVPQVMRSFERSLQFHRRLFDYTPDGKINVLLHDLWHYGNAGARPLPENHITIGIEPYAHEYESAPAPERMTSSLNHEMAHIVTVDKATSGDRFLPLDLLRQGHARPGSAAVDALRLPDHAALVFAALVPGRDRHLSRDVDERRARTRHRPL